MGKILGIDLGTTNSAMALWDGARPRLVLAEDHRPLLPSVVAFTEDGDMLVGEAARRQAAANPERTIYSAKRFIGRKYRTAAQDRKAVAYEVVAGENGEALFRIGDRWWMPEEISAEVLRRMKETAESLIGEPLEGAVITVPAYFNNPQREATKEAGRLAGLDVLRIVNEPTAAALAYGLDKIEDPSAVVAVYDFGGGTFDVSVLAVGDDVVEVIATHGDTHLGGDDIDACVVAWILEQHDGAPLDDDPEVLELLRSAAKQAKVNLTANETAGIDLEIPAAGGREAVRIQASLTRAAFEKLIGELVDRTIASCRQVLEDAKKKPDEVTEVVLVGGSSRIPLVRRRVAKFFGREPRAEVNPDEVVALGAAVQGAILGGELKGLVLVDVTSLSLGIENHEGRSVVVIPRNSSIPTEASRIFTTSAEGQTSLQFHVVQGESGRAAENESLGRFDLEGLPDAPVGTLRIEVTFVIDINGMVQVHARDVDTGIAQRVTISVITAKVPEAAREPRATPEEPKGATAGKENRSSAARTTLDEAEHLLHVPGRKMTGVDRASLTKRSIQLRGFLEGPASASEVEEARVTLQRVIDKVKAYKPPRPRAE